MDEKTKKMDSLMNRLWRLSHKYAELEKTPIRYDADVTLPPGEVHSIQAIGKNADINVKDLGKHFGISKSAASQMVSRLVKKGYVVKSNPADNHKELRLSLTARGWEAFSLHERFHARHQEKLISRLQTAFSEAEIRRADGFFQLIEEVIDERLQKYVFKK